MDFHPTTFALAYLAGVLSTLSPCVVPLLPILVASALAQHRWGVWALAAGLALSFAVVGLFVATIGVSIGIDGDVLRRVAGAMLVVFGAVLLVPMLQRAFATVTARVASGGHAALDRTSGRGWQGQAAVGLLLGLVWTPCVGPTLGAASTLASQGRDLGAVAALMIVFGLGASTPLVVVGTVSQRFGLGSRRSWLGAAEWLRRGLGVVLVALGLALLTGADKRLESWLVDVSPAWLTELTTRY